MSSTNDGGFMPGQKYSMKRSVVIAFSLSALLSTGVPQRALATDYTVAGCDIASAINSVNSGSGGDRILIPPGTYTLSAQLPAIILPVTIQGNGGRAVIDAVLTGKTVLRIFPYMPGTVTLSNLTIANGRNSLDPAVSDVELASSGGIIWDGSGGNLTIDNCTIINNTSDKGDGGGIAAYDPIASGSAKLTISNSIIQNNTATDGSGGGIFVGQKIDLIMSGTTVTGNKAGAASSNFGQGGGLFLFGPAGGTGSSITSSSFTNNTAIDAGGAIYTTAPITFSSVSYSSNSAMNGNDVWNNIDGTLLFSAAVNAAPVVTAGGTVTFTEHIPAKTVAPGFTVADSDNANLVGATITISATAVSGDTLALPAIVEIDGTVTDVINGHITSSYNAATYTLTLSGTATKEKYQAALRTVTYANNRHDLSDGSRTISFVVNDGVELSSAATSAISFVAVNDAPLLTSTARTFTTITEDDITNSGQLVSSITGSTIGTNLITDLDYNPTNDPATGQRGIAVTDQSVTGGGKWQYSLDGTTWADFGSVATATSLLLRSTDKIRFLPDGMNGGSASFIYRAWDQSSGTAGTMADTSTNGDITPYSINSATASIAITPINDAPGFSADAALAAVLQGGVNPPGDTVTNLFGSKFQDVDSGASLGGLAVSANSASAATQGKWQYSTDSGTNWYDVATVAGNAALALSSATKIRFLPVAAFYGAPDSLSVSAVDNSYAGSWSNGATRVTTNVNSNGGTTPYAAVARALTTSITPVASMSTKSIVIDPVNANKMYAGVDGEGVFRSIDAGVTWLVPTTQANKRVQALVISPLSATTLYAATYGGGLFASSDSGDHWSVCTGQPTNQNSTALVIDPSGNLYAGTEGGIFTSSNCSLWSDVSDGLTVNAAKPPVTIVIDPISANSLFAGFDGGGIWKTANSGTLWTSATTQPTNLRVKALAIKDSLNLYAATFGNGVFKSNDSGATWSACGVTGMTNQYLLSLVIDASGKLYAGSEAGVFVSEDGCGTWNVMNGGLP
jgi:predicted outer membrane repeat protein